MKGVIFIRREHGDNAWDTLLDEAQLDGVYTSLGSYPDQHLHSLVAAAAASLNQPPETVVRWFGREALNPSAVETTGALLLRNSWGTGWGTGGYGWLPYDYALRGLAVDWWALPKNEWIDSGNFKL